MRTYIGADSLALSVDGLTAPWAMKMVRSGAFAFYDHCFTGDYPTGLTDQQDDGHVKQLSLLAEQA